MIDNFNDVTEAFDGWLTTLTGSRDSGSYVDGRWVVSSAASLSFKGVVQNATPTDLKVLPEGERDIEAIKIHTQFELKIKDLIPYQSGTWLIYNIAVRSIGGYYKAIAIKQ